jgi:4-hydroxy-3-methylbut-2-en-1-yl diphosphate reductase
VTSDVLLLVSTRREQRALAAHGSRAEVVRTSGAGSFRDESTVPSSTAAGRHTAVAVAGLAHGLQMDVVPGTIVVADRVLAENGSVLAILESSALIAAELMARGAPVMVGSIISIPDGRMSPTAKASLAATGALAVDRQTARLLEPPWDIPAAAVRVVVDDAHRGWPRRTPRTRRSDAVRQLREVGQVLQAWGQAISDRRVLLAGPRSFCAGVERAIATVEQALDRYGAPVYVRRQIVHNRHVVEGLESRGAVFVQELDDVPQGAIAVLSAHGVSPAVRADAAARDLRVIDATCPLVSKVHSEVRRFAERGFQMVLIGHHGHDETEGTVGESDDISIVARPEDVERLEVRDPQKLAYLTQTTLSPSDVSSVVAKLSERFPDIVGPRSADICYATQNRQDAVLAIAPDCELVLVVGSSNSSNAARLVEVSERAGCRAALVDDESQLRLEWFRHVRTVGVTAAASSPPELVDRVVQAVRGIGATEIETRVTATENVTFPLPMEVR